jgi:hypothetical protein
MWLSWRLRYQESTRTCLVIARPMFAAFAASPLISAVDRIAPVLLVEQRVQCLPITGDRVTYVQGQPRSLVRFIVLGRVLPVASGSMRHGSYPSRRAETLERSQLAHEQRWPRFLRR